MKILLFDKNTKKGEFINYGLGKLRLVSKCEVTEEINARYDAELLISMQDKKQKLIKKWCLLWIDGQIFRVVNRKDIDKSNEVRIFIKHIFYDINYGFIVDNKAENKTVEEAMKIAIPSDFMGVYTVKSDIKNLNTLYFVKNNGAENFFNIIERWGQGELVRDNFNIAINKNKGRDNGVTFTYKKIDAIEIDEDTENVVTRLYPTGKDGISLEEKFIIIPGWNTEDYPPFHITKEVKFEGAESTGELRVLAEREAAKIGLSRVNFKINVHDLANTVLAKHMPQLYEVEVGDIVTIKHHKLDVRVKVKCIKKVHEKVTNKLTLEFGQPLENFFDAVDNSNNQITIPDTTRYEDHMFFYYNDKEEVFNNTRNDICYLRYGVGEETNLMLYATIFLKVEQACIGELILNVDNVPREFKPKLSLEPGWRCFNFTYPLIRTEGGKSHTLNLVLNLESGATVIAPKENIHIAIKGQNVTMAMKEPPKADVQEIFNFVQTEYKELGTKSNVVVDIRAVKKAIVTERIDLSKLNLKEIQAKGGVEITLLNRGYNRPLDNLNYNYDNEKVVIKDGIAKMKDKEVIVGSRISETQFNTGVIQEIELVDASSFYKILGGEFIID